ncbi:hypothetical protein [Streptomyces carpaticus]|uniref:DUF732 domain-containing protein n=1 Tax=Streptomyces carpaticus TaxID=285558 RepID=A0ABV4ZJL7_9ACTN
MRRYRLALALAMLLAVGGVLVLNQCSARGGGGEVTVGGERPDAEADGAPRTDPDADAGAARETENGEGEDGPGPADDGPGDGEPAPAPQDPPAAGPGTAPAGLTADQRGFVAALSDTPEVPPGTDPAAVLELGTEACDRLGYLGRHATEEETVAALRDGEIPQAAAAITHLCPEYGDLLDRAQEAEEEEEETADR